MGRYCVVCGELRGEDGICRNPHCRINNKGADVPGGGSTALKPPIRLTDRLKQSRAKTESDRDHFPAAPEEDSSFLEEPEQRETVEWDDSEEWEDPAEELPAPSEEYSRGSGYSRGSVSSRLQTFRRELSGDSAESRNLRGLLTLMTSVLFAAGGTLIFGFLYLEDFLWRWTVTGVLVPVMAYGFSLLYGWLFLTLGRRERGVFGTRSELLNLFNLVTSTGRLPNMLLLLTCFLAPLDKNLGIFQFFALLLVIAWLVSLLFYVLCAYRSCCNGITLLLSVVFAFLAFATMRSVWVWYLTGDFCFTLYIPLNIFF